MHSTLTSTSHRFLTIVRASLLVGVASGPWSVAVAYDSDESRAVLDRVQVTGSRIYRTDSGGAEFMYSASIPSHKGSDITGGHALIDKTDVCDWLMAGVPLNSRDILLQHDRSLFRGSASTFAKFFAY